MATYCWPSGPAIGDRLADDRRSRLELPQHFAAAGIDRLEPAVHGSVEDHVAGGGDGAAPDRKFLLDRPDRLALHGSQAVNSPRLPAGPGVHIARWRRRRACRRCSSPRRPRRPCRGCGAGCRASRCAARRPTAASPSRPARPGRCRGRPCRSSAPCPVDQLQPAGLEVDAVVSVLMARTGSADSTSPVVRSMHVDVAVALGVDQHLARLPADRSCRAGCSR